MLAGSHGLRADLPTVRIGSCRRKATSRTPWCHTLCWWYGLGPASKPDDKSDLLIYSNRMIERLLNQNVLVGGCFAESNKYMSNSCHTPSPRLTSYCSNQSSPTATHALKGSAQISQWPILPLSSKALNL